MLIAPVQNRACAFTRMAPALDSGDQRELPDLMAAADAALYRAKGCGRDQVQMISTTRGLSAAGGPGAGAAARGETPIAFRRAVNS